MRCSLPALSTPASYNLLRNSKTIILPNSDYDVFGDGTVIIKYTPGHTPGHRCQPEAAEDGTGADRGTVWHYTAERTDTRAPGGEANARTQTPGQPRSDGSLPKTKRCAALDRAPIRQHSIASKRLLTTSR